MAFILSEAYSDLYNPRVDSNLDDNLRFIDYMQSEDIEEVVESIFWELRDYGHTIEEAFDLLDFTTSTEVMLESSDQIILEYRVTQGQGSLLAAKARVAARKEGRAQQRAAARAARVNAAKETVKRFVSGAMGGVQRGVSGAMGGVQRGVSGAMGGVQRGVSGAMGGVRRAASAVSGAAQEGKARLMQLMRSGLRAASERIGRARGAVSSSARSGLRSASERIGRAGEAVSGSGRRAAMPRSYDVQTPIGRLNITRTPSPESGARRRAFGARMSQASERIRRMADQ